MTTDLERLAAKRAARVATAEQATADLRAAVREAVAAGMSEVQAAKVAGVSRMTVRSWLGKDVPARDTPTTPRG